MSIRIAENAGFCFGVKRATDRLESAINGRSEGERIFTLGNSFCEFLFCNIKMLYKL